MANYDIASELSYRVSEKRRRENQVASPAFDRTLQRLNTVAGERVKGRPVRLGQAELSVKSRRLKG